MAGIPSACYSITVRLEIINRPGMLGKVTSAIGRRGGLELSERYFSLSVLDKRVVERVAAAVSAAADESGLVQRKKLRSPRR